MCQNLPLETILAPLFLFERDIVPIVYKSVLSPFGGVFISSQRITPAPCSRTAVGEILLFLTRLTDRISFYYPLYSAFIIHNRHCSLRGGLPHDQDSVLNLEINEISNTRLSVGKCRFRRKNDTM